MNLIDLSVKRPSHRHGRHGLVVIGIFSFTP